MLERVFESMFHWYRLVGGASGGARALERDGVLAAVVPAAPERAVVNAVLYTNAAGLAAAYDELEAAYREIGAKWTVWVPPGDGEAVRLLEERGHFLDAQPAAMGRELAGTERPPGAELPDWSAQGSLEDVGRVTDRAYTFGTDSWSRSLRTLPEDAAHVYVARDGGEPVAALITVDTGPNTEVQMVAVVPEARGRGLSGSLLGHALADAAERGQETTTLIATKLGRPVYERLGYRPLGQVSMYERPAG